MNRPPILVFSSLWPSDAAPSAGIFIRERLVRVAARRPVVVVSPQPWSPFDPLVRLWRPAFRPRGPVREVRDGIEVLRPRWFSLPGVFKRFDAALMALGARATVRRLVSARRPALVDAHFLYPDGAAAARLARAHGLPLVVTLRGSKDEWLIGTDREPQLRETLRRADRVVSVCDALARDVAGPLGCPPASVTVIGNGVDTDRFAPIDRARARAELGLPAKAPILIGVGALVPRKGFQRLIPLLPALRERHPGLVLAIVGGGATHGDLAARLAKQARDLGVGDAVRFFGPQLPERLATFYSAADVFTLATEHEGWANVFLEAMACGLPVVTTDVGGNAQVVCSPGLGRVVPYWDPSAFTDALDEALRIAWDRDAIRAHACAHGWAPKVGRLLSLFDEVEAAARVRSDPAAQAGIRGGAGASASPAPFTSMR